jgi:hypothetical protein
MEVHHHPKIEKKNFKEYFLEFLMIFLAVTLGFFAEGLREHISDNQKEEQYVQSLTEDLEADTARIDIILRFDEEKLVQLSSIYNCYDTVTQNLKATACMGALVKYSKVNKPFQSNDRTIIQLANAGGYRLLTKEDADSILSYQSVYKQYHDFESTVFQQAQDNVRNTLNELADFRAVAGIQKASTLSGVDSSSTILPGPLLFSDNRELLNKWFNQLQLYVRVTNAQHLILSQLKIKAITLIKFYKHKHHLE